MLTTRYLLIRVVTSARLQYVQESRRRRAKRSARIGVSEALYCNRAVPANSGCRLLVGMICTEKGSKMKKP